MIGVVVWSSHEQETAVIWCDHDSGLAYLNGESNFMAEGWPQPGDLVELERVPDSDHLAARRVRPVPAAPIAARAANSNRPDAYRTDAHRADASLAPAWPRLGMKRPVALV